MERVWKPNVEMSPNCPRCGSCNTKFCYYNNYSLTQPRYFCKGCRRYWTKGGSLRNVPVGGGCRKSRRSGKAIRASLSDHHHHRFPSRAFDLVEPASSSTTVPDQGGSTIDLAQVFANFLNQRPEPPPKSQFEMPEFPSDHFDQVPFQFSNLSNVHLDLGTAHFPLENGVIGCGGLSDRSSETHQSDGGAMYLCGTSEFVEKQQETVNQFTSDPDHLIIGYSGLPPLPGEEVRPSDMGWLSPEMMHISQLPAGIESESQHSDHLLGNYMSSSLAMSTSYGTPFGP